MPQATGEVLDTYSSDRENTRMKKGTRLLKLGLLAHAHECRDLSHSATQHRTTPQPARWNIKSAACI